MNNNEIILSGEAAQIKFNELKAAGLILYEIIVGSQSYGTNIASSDVDRKFVYADTLDNILSNNVITQLSITNDYTGFEISRYLELLRKQNPNIIEILHTDNQFVEFEHPYFKELIKTNKDKFLSKKIAFSFGAYAISQIGKAQGTNKKFMNPMEKERKTLLDFCWIAYDQGTKSLREYMKNFLGINIITGGKYFPDWVWGCTALDHMKNCYNLYFDKNSAKAFIETDDELLHDVLYSKRKYNGIIDKNGVQIKFSSVKKGKKPITTFYCNIEGFQKYCKDYKEYWEWVEKRNIQRFVENSENENNYDRKNMMHCHRLLNMCIEILSGEGVNVYRKDREYLLSIRNGNETYNTLVQQAEEKQEKIKELVKTTNLKDECSKEIMDSILLDFRKEIYNL